MNEIFDQELYDHSLESARKYYGSEEFMTLYRYDLLDGALLCFDSAKLLREELNKEEINRKVALELVRIIEIGSKRVANSAYAVSEFDRQQRAKKP